MSLATNFRLYEPQVMAEPIIELNELDSRIQLKVRRLHGIMRCQVINVNFRMTCLELIPFSGQSALQ